MTWPSINPKLLSGRYVLTVAGSIVFVKIGWVLANLITPERAGDALLLVGSWLTTIIICYFNKPPENGVKVP
jgi:hypothetical protein